MKLLHHVKKHGKTITLHLKKHHKKYIFGILSATLLWKGVSLIAAYALVHNLSFSFADTVHQGEGDNEEIVSEETINNNESDNGNNLDGDDGIIGNGDDGINGDGDDGNNLDGDDGIIGDGDDGIIGNGDDGINGDGDDGIIGDGDDGINGEGNDGIIGDGDDGKCDRGDIEITNPVGGNIVGGTFDILREFKNDDCFDTEYTIKLRTKSGQLGIFSGNSENTGFSFDSTQLDSDYYTGYNLTIYGNDTIYREEEGGDFTIDNKAPTLSDITISFSTRNNKLNIGDTATLSFESDEELTGINVNIQGQSAYLQEKEGNKYTYTMEFSDKNTTGKIVYGIDYSDEIGNTGYYEGYENIELDYTKPEISNLEMSYNKENEITVRFDTNEETNAHIVYILSGLNKTESIDSTERTGHEVVLQNIRNKYIYNYSISIEDGAKNTINIGGNFQLSGNRVIFTNKEISSSDLLIEAGFKTGDENFLKDKYNSFETCSQNITFKKLDLPIDGVTGKIAIPNFNDSNVNKLTNAFTIVLVEKLEGMALTQNAMDEIFEDLNNFLIIVKLVKDDKNECKQNMTHYYINRFKRTLTKYGIIK